MEKRNNADHSKFNLFWNDKEIRWDEKSILNKQEIAKALFAYFFDTKNGLSAEDRQRFFDFYKQKKIIQEEFKKNCFDFDRGLRFSFIYGGKEYFLLSTQWSGNKPGEQFDLLISVASQYGFRIEKASDSSKSHSKTAKSLKETVSACPTEECTPTTEKIKSNEEKDARDAKFRTEIEKTWIDGNLCFCTDDVVMKDNVVNILTGLFSGMKNIFTERYQKMCANWSLDWWNKRKFDDWKQTEADLEFVQPIEKILKDKDGKQKRKKNGDFQTRTIFLDALLAVPYCYWKSDWNSEIFKNYNNIGHDMPTWLYYKSNADGNVPVEERPRVMLISQDPLRSDHGKDKRLLLSTPWAFHSSNYIHKRNGDFSSMKELQIVHSYLNRGAIVYLTDYMKIFCRDTNDVPLSELKDNFSKVIYENISILCEKALMEEIRIFKPDIIVTMSGTTAKALTGCDSLNECYTNDSLKKIPLYKKLEDIGFHGSIYTKRHTSRSNGNNNKKEIAYSVEYWLKDGSDRLGSGDYVIADIFKCPGQK